MLSFRPAARGAGAGIPTACLRLSRKGLAVGEDFSVKLARKGLLADDVRLTEYSLNFQSAPLTGRFTAQEFYQDPQDPTQKKVVATIAFTHPVDKAEFEKAARVELVTKRRCAVGKTVSLPGHIRSFCRDGVCPLRPSADPGP